MNKEAAFQEKLVRAQRKVASDMSDSRLKEIPVGVPWIGNAEKVLMFHSGRLEVYVFCRGLWRRKIRINYARNVHAEVIGQELHLRMPDREECFSVQQDRSSGEVWFRLDRRLRNNSRSRKNISCDFSIRYFQEGPLAEFSYASYKWMCRGMNLEKYPYPDFAELHLSDLANNQLFYNSSGGIYLGCAWLDHAQGWVSEPGRDRTLNLMHRFRSRKKITLEPGEEKKFSFAVFAGCGPEEQIGVLSDVLWRLNSDPFHVPQTDMRTFLKNYVSVWPRAELTGEQKGDHYAAHFFVNFYGNFPDGYYPPDQFGCSWLAYDLLKADYFCRLHDRTGEKDYLDRAAGIVRFYCRHHFIGNTHLTWPFHTGSFMKTCPPFCEKDGWGAPLDAGYLDSLAQSEMIFDALMICRRHPELFPENYAHGIADDVLKMQQNDGHFRRRYNENLEPEVKPGWIDQNYESQSWIPTLLLLAELGEERCRQAAVRCGEAALFDLEIKGMFAMGGGETDYPTLWDVDGYRSMLRAMLALFHATGEKRWLDGAEKVQSFSSTMMCGYNVEIPEGTFYHSIHWRCRGMVATSFYWRPDYLRSFCTPTGNQSVCWVGYLLLQLYRATGKRIYADRGIAAIRQVLVYRDEKSLKGKSYMKNLLYTIFENNPQMSDSSGGYEAGVAQDGYSMFIDLYLYLDNVLEEFGDVFCDLEHGELLGINCFQCEDIDFEQGRAVIRNELGFARPFTLRRSDGKTFSYEAAAGGLTAVCWKEEQ